PDDRKRRDVMHGRRRRVLRRIAGAPGSWPFALSRFASEEVEPIAYECVGTIEGEPVSEASLWLDQAPRPLNSELLCSRLSRWRDMTPVQVAELVFLLHRRGDENALSCIAGDPELYGSPGPQFTHGEVYRSQAEIAFIGLARRDAFGPGAERAALQALRALSTFEPTAPHLSYWFGRFFQWAKDMPRNASDCPEFASLARKLAGHLKTAQAAPDRNEAIAALLSWADSLEKRWQGRKHTDEP
ncbi:MAG: hypothetical protein AAB654_05290, partial [Acidobacteriota bacterium]